MSAPTREVVVIDSGGANLASVRFALERLDCAAVVTTDAQRIAEAERVILPGVGAAGDVMARLRQHGLDALVPTLRQPLLGICVGLQVLFRHCEEDQVDTIGLFEGTVRRLQVPEELSVPQMGWNRIDRTCEHALFHGLDADAHFYFVHSYAAPPGPHTLATAQYGAPFTAVAGRRNVLATQFHPERSARWGHQILANFLSKPAESLLCA